MKTQPRGFTLIELIVVVLIIGILAAIALIGYGVITNKTYDTAAEANLANYAKQILAKHTADDELLLTRSLTLEALNETRPGFEGTLPGDNANNKNQLLGKDGIPTDDHEYAIAFAHTMGGDANDTAGPYAVLTTRGGSGLFVRGIALMTGTDNAIPPQQVAEGTTPGYVLEHPEEFANPNPSNPGGPGDDGNDDEPGQDTTDNGPGNNEPHEGLEYYVASRIQQNINSWFRVSAEENRFPSGLYFNRLPPPSLFQDFTIKNEDFHGYGWFEVEASFEFSDSEDPLIHTGDLSIFRTYSDGFEDLFGVDPNDLEVRDWWVRPGIDIPYEYEYCVSIGIAGTNSVYRASSAHVTDNGYSLYEKNLDWVEGDNPHTYYIASDLAPVEPGTCN